MKYEFLNFPKKGTSLKYRSSEDKYIFEFLLLRIKKIKSLLYIFVYFCTAFPPFITVTPVSSGSLNTAQKLGITFGSVTFCVTIFVVFAYRYKQQKKSKQTTISSRRNESVQTQNLAMANTYRNATTANAIHVPHTISMPAMPSAPQEDRPPSYSACISSLTTLEQERFNRF
jgi:hypothetical protein